MRRISSWVLAGVLPAAFLTVLALGCSGSNPTTKSGGGGGSGGSSDEMKAVASKGRATIKGKVVLNSGKKPDELKAKDADLLKAINQNQNKDFCLAMDARPEEKEQQAWRVNDKGEVQYAFIFVKPPDGQYFKMEKDDLDPMKGGWKKEDVIDQPHCMFEPHVIKAFPSYYDADKGGQKTTGQVIKVINSAKVVHNTKYEGGNEKLDPGDTKKGMELNIKPSSSKPTPISCNIHPWMGAYIWALDHPYGCVTDKDGNFEIKNVPAGAKISVVAWHEVPGIFKTEDVELKDGDTKDLGTLKLDYK